MEAKSPLSIVFLLCIFRCNGNVVEEAEAVWSVFFSVVTRWSDYGKAVSTLPTIK